MTIEAAPNDVGDLGGRAEREIEPGPSGRDRLEALGLLVGLLAILLGLALTVGPVLPVGR